MKYMQNKKMKPSPRKLHEAIIKMEFVMDITETRKIYTKQLEFTTAMFDYYSQYRMIKTKTYIVWRN